MGLVVIKVPFRDLDVVINVAFLFLQEDKSTLLPMKDMLQKGLDTFIQGQYVSLGWRHHRLRMENYFLIHRRTPEDVSYVFYTEQGLTALHRNFCYPSVKAL